MKKIFLTLSVVCIFLAGCAGGGAFVELPAEGEEIREASELYSGLHSDESHSDSAYLNEVHSAHPNGGSAHPGGESDVPQNAIAISASFMHNLAITADGALWAWGAADDWTWLMSVGDGTSENRREPVKIMEDVARAAAGPHHSFAIAADGGLYTWGGNSWGNVGDGTTEPRLSPVRVLDDVVYAVMPFGVPCSHVGYVGARTYAIRADGSLWAWGSGEGEAWLVALGDGSGENQLLPVEILQNVSAVVPTQTGGFAITDDNTLYHWHGQSWIFNSETGESVEIPARLSPEPIMQNIAKVSRCGNFVITTAGELMTPEGERIMYNVSYALRAGRANFAITTDGALYAWGQNRLPDHWRPGPTLGDGTTIDREMPVRIMDNAVSMIAVGNTAYVIDGGGTLWGWGNFGAAWGGEIALGDGSEFSGSHTDLWEDGVLEFAYEYRDGYRFESGLRWNLPDDGGTGIRLSPVRIMENVAQVDATYVMFDHGWIRSFRAFAVTNDGELWAWGANDDFDRGFGLLGDGTSERRVSPVKIIASCMGGE
ncbi:MAG: hypothetical protein FWC70_00510 [Defluviitaleaceae bacterium]|nr:hypothetical protein [Defluviitaleaceae bacterium]